MSHIGSDAVRRKKQTQAPPKEFGERVKRRTEEIQEAARKEFVEKRTESETLTDLERDKARSSNKGSGTVTVSEAGWGDFPVWGQRKKKTAPEE